MQPTRRSSRVTSTLRICLAITTGLLGSLAAQAKTSDARVPLPPDAHSLAHLPGWTVIAAADLSLQARPTDPTEEPARAMLLSILAAFAKTADQNPHVLLHSPGPKPGELRLVNAYSSPGGLASADLQASAAGDALQKALLARLTSPGVTATFVGASKPELFAIGSSRLQFELTAPNGHYFVDYDQVPAGERLQTFESVRSADDVDARAAFDALLRTFDGAREGGSDPVLRAMLIGGAIGAVGGVIASLLRRRLRPASAAGSETAAR